MLFRLKRIVAVGIICLLPMQDLAGAISAVQARPQPAISLSITEAFTQQALIPGLLNWFKRSYDLPRSLQLGKTLAHAWISWSRAHPALSVSMAVGTALVLHAFQLHTAAAGAGLSAMAALGTAENKDPQDQIREVLKHRRSLIFSSNADSIDAALLAESRAQGSPYLRVTLRNQADLDRLMTDVHERNGKVERLAGRLRHIVRDGGVLLIDYAETERDMADTFNPLHDKRPYFGEDVASPDLQIVAVMSDDQIANHSSTIYSRFQHVSSIEIPFEDPLDQIERVGSDYPPLYRKHATGTVNGMESEDVQLFRGPDFRELLLGHLRLNSDGSLQWTLEAALLNAIQGPSPQNEKRNKALVIHGANWDDSAFTGFLRQILLTRQFEVNGKVHTLPPDFRVYRADTDFSKGVDQVNILAPDESTSQNGRWIINRLTQDILFERTSLNAQGNLVTEDGILDHNSQNPIRLRITERLDDWVWHRMMHTPYADIEVAPGVYIPKEYRAFRSDAQKQTVVEMKTEPFDEAFSHRSLLVETNDPAVALDRIQQGAAGRHVTTYPITPETTLADLVASLEVTEFTQDTLRFEPDEKGVLKAFKEGDIVVLEGLETNPDLARQLEPALAEHPYLTNYNIGGLLEKFPGQLVVVAKTAAPLDIQVAHRTKMNAEDAALATILAREFPNRFTEDVFERILRLRKSFESLPAPLPEGRYPREADFSLDRLRLLLRQTEPFGPARRVADYTEMPALWLDAFENVFISEYAEAPETAAFLRTRVRLEFGVEETGRRPNSLVEAKLKRALNKLIPGEDPADHIWELADAMSLDLLQKLAQEKAVGSEFSHISLGPVRQVADAALIKNSTGERQAFYRHRAKMENADVADAADIDRESPVGVITWPDLIRRIQRAFTVTPFVMLKGLPGTGKSHMASQIWETLGYNANEVFGPITVGSDTAESDIIARRVLENGKSKLELDTVAKWAFRKEGGLLVVDEANLTNPAFWNFLRGLSAPQPYIWINGHRTELSARHRVLFTGNQESMTGRKWQDLLRRYAITIDFSPFSDTFLLNHINENVESQMRRPEPLAKLVLELHRLFERVGTNLTFSLRDVDELVARIFSLAHIKTPGSGSPMTPEGDWTVERVVGIAWDQYQGNFDPDQRQALEFLLVDKYGVVIKDWEAKRIANIRAKYADHFRRAQITLVDTTALMIAAIEDLLQMRTARIEKKTVIQGKRGLILEGPSGRGKDDPLAAALEAMGLFSDLRAPSGTPRHQLYYHRTARPDNNEDLLRAIRTAQAWEDDSTGSDVFEGSIAAISESNLLPTAFLEGKLNDALTGKAKPGFNFATTINSSGVSGRGKFSSALINRVIYRREFEYPEKDLQEILEDQASVPLQDKRLTEEHIRHAVRAHLWVRDTIQDVSLKPTPRELIRLVERWRGAAGVITPAEAHAHLVAVYGPIYLDKVLKGKPLPSRKWLLEEFVPADPVDPIQMMQHLVNAQVRNARGATVQFHGGEEGTPLAYHTADSNAYTVRADAFRKGDWQESLYHEIGHGRRTRHFPRLTPNKGERLDDLKQDLEDLRQLAGLTADLPASRMSDPSQEHLDFADMVRSRAFDKLFAWSYEKDLRLRLHKGFSLLLSTYAMGLITEEQAARFAEETAILFRVNPFQTALPFLGLALDIAAAFSTLDEEEEHQHEQFRMLTRVHAMREAYESIPDWNDQPLAPSEEKQQAAVDQALNELRGADLRPQTVAQQAATRAATPAPTKKEAAAKLRAAKRKVAAALKTTRKEVLQQLNQMEKDLQWRGGMTAERMQQMEQQLTSFIDPTHLLLKVRQLNDVGIDKKLKDIHERLQDKMANETPGTGRVDRWTFRISPHAQTILIVSAIIGIFGVASWVASEFVFDLEPVEIFNSVSQAIFPGQSGGGEVTQPENLPTTTIKAPDRSAPSLLNWGIALVRIASLLALMGLALFTASKLAQFMTPKKERAAPIGPRAGWGSHGPSGIQDLVPVDVTRRDIERSSQKLRTREIVERNPQMAKVSRAQAKDLNAALAEFIEIRRNPDRVFGPDGVLNYERLFRTLNPAISHLRSGRKGEEHPKGLVLHGKLNGSLIMEELFHFLFEKGFSVTIYTDEHTFVDGIRTLGDLKAVADGTPVSQELIENDMKKRLGINRFEIVDVDDLQKKVEASYTYGAFRMALDERRADHTSRNVGTLSQFHSPDRPAGDIFNDELAIIIAWLRSLGLTFQVHKRMKVDPDSDQLALDLRGLEIDTLEPLKGMRSIAHIFVSAGKIRGWDSLAEIPNLSLILSESPGETEAWKYHRSRPPESRWLAHRATPEEIGQFGSFQSAAEPSVQDQLDGLKPLEAQWTANPIKEGNEIQLAAKTGATVKDLRLLPTLPDLTQMSMRRIGPIASSDWPLLATALSRQTNLIWFGIHWDPMLHWSPMLRENEIKEFARAIFLAHPNRKNLEVILNVAADPSGPSDPRRLLASTFLSLQELEARPLEKLVQKQIQALRNVVDKWDIDTSFDGDLHLEARDGTMFSDLQQLPDLPALGELGLTHMRISDTEMAALPRELSRFQRLSTLLLPHDGASSPTFLSEATAIFRAHANREHLGIGYYWNHLTRASHVLSDEQIAALATRQQLSPSARTMLMQILNGLVNPVETMTAVRKRFAEQDQAAAFDSALNELHPELARLVTPPAQAPITHALWKKIAPSAWQRSAFLTASFTALFESLLWLAPMGMFARALSAGLPGTQVPFWIGVVVSLSMVGIAALISTYLFLPIHAWTPRWLGIHGVQGTPVGRATRDLSRILGGTYAMAAVAAVQNPLLGLAIAALGVLIHAGHDYRIFKPRRAMPHRIASAA